MSDNDLQGIDRIPDRPRLGISSCLLGNQVRYDGGHKLDRYLANTLGGFVDFVPVCPEVECGMSVPREAMRLVGDPDNPRLVTRKTGEDKTEQMIAWTELKLDELEREDLSGFIFKAKSPSSGMGRVKVYSEDGGVKHNGVGVFARAFMNRFPLLPVEDDGRLNDPGLREKFIERVFAYRRLRDARAKGPGPGDLVDYHTRHKLLVLAHDPERYREMGRLVADGGRLPPGQLFDEYARLMNEAMDKRATPKKHVNVLMHAMGYFKNDLSADEKQELLEIIDNYKQGLTPLIVPVTLINHFVRKYDKEYLRDQHYLKPHPIELRLRNHV
jgi:uncharacterized protein YbgA (DUF1722 family)/uncharacterized protein YbbK (DUF523 family)